MEIIPSINCPEVRCVKEKLDAAKKFLSAKDLVHLDVADARFTFNKTWGDPAGWSKLKPSFELEVHLMVEEPEKQIEGWLTCGAKRVIVHREALPKDVPMDAAERILKKCAAYEAEAMLAINPETPISELLRYTPLFSWFQILAVNPGLAAQKFLPLVLEKIKYLRLRIPSAKIEVDGGVDLENAKLIKAAGANAIVSATYIFDNENPKDAYEMLKSL